MGEKQQIIPRTEKQKEIYRSGWNEALETVMQKLGYHKCKCGRAQGDFSREVECLKTSC